MLGHMNVKVKRECHMVRVVTEILDSVSGGRRAVNRTPTQQADMPPWHWLRLHRRAQKKTIFLILAKHRTAPWWWFLREPKHVWASIIILKLF